MQFTAKILSNATISPGYWRIRLSAPDEFVHARPGQFVMARVGSGDPLLRRPLAIFDTGTEKSADGSQTWFEMLYKVVGKGTAILSALREADTVDILGPLGSGFAIDSDEEGSGESLLVGGGIGLAPLHLLAARLAGRQSPVHLFAGGRTHDDLLCLAEFERLGAECHCATEDGSFGVHGFVTEALERHLEAFGNNAAIYACGPDAMLRVLAGIAAERNIPCQVSLEARMACGVGACLGCVTPGREHSPQVPDYRCVCTDGPVFPSSELAWRA